MTTKVNAALLVLVAALMSGCARYDIHLVQPSQFAQTIGKEPAPLEAPPLEYQFSQRHGRLSIRVFNPTDSPITLLGNKSYLVPPSGQSHPFGGGTIAPRSYVGFLLPPEPPRYRAGPSFSLGLGWGGHFMHDPFWYPYGGFHYPFYTGPGFTYLEGQQPWDWKQGPLTLRLVYEQERPATNAWEHTFVFSKEKRR